MTKTIIPVAAALLAITALAVTVTRDARIAALEQRISTLQAQLGTDASARSFAPSLPAPGEKSTTGDKSVQPLSSTDLLPLEDRIASLEQRTADFDELHNIMVLKGALPPTPEDVAKAKLKVLNTDATHEARVKALETVRRSKTEARSRDVVLSMIELLETTPLPRIQRKIFEGLVGIDDPELKEPIRNALEQSNSTFVREQAARALVGYRNEPVIRAWLEVIAEQDTNGNVRGQARRILEQDP